MAAQAPQGAQGMTPDSFMAQQEKKQPSGLLSQIFAPRSVPTRTTPLDQTPLPGSTEGPGMLEGLADYSKASAGEMGGGIKDVVHGDVAKGAHRIISGTANAVAPVALPMAAAAAPAATATTLAAGALGQQIGKRGSQALGANEDQSDLAGDVTGLAAGYGGSKVGSGKIAQSMKVLAQPAADAASKLPVLDKLFSAGKALGKYKDTPGQLAEIWGKKPVYSEATEPQQLPEDRLPAAFQAPKPKAAPVVGTADRPFQGGQAGQLAQSIQAPAAKGISGFSRNSLGSLLNKSLGAEESKVQPGKPIYQRSAGPPSGAISGADMPEGHTAHQSSAIPSSMYDSGAKEFHARMVSGNTSYVYGDVSPEEAQAFTDAESKGKAFQQIKNGHPLVAKIVNGKRLPVKASQ